MSTTTQPDRDAAGRGSAADPAADEAAIRAADAQRCAAIGARDRAALSATLTEDLSYMHSTGQRDDKESYISMSIEGIPRRVGRGDTEVLLYGDIAVVRGDYTIDIEPDAGHPGGRHVDSSGLQVWRREDGTWRLFLHQGTAYPKPAR
jgi:ketosteroid isomerase-like protein